MSDAVRVDQFVPSLTLHDAISEHARHVRRVLLEAGYQSDIYTEVMDPSLATVAKPYLKARAPAAGEVMLYHASTNSAMGGWLAHRVTQGGRLFCYYHNITPAAFFWRWRPETASAMVTARRQLARLAPDVDLALANSAYSESELRDLGYRRTVTSPLLFDLEAYYRPPRVKTVARLRLDSEGGHRWLFVGPMAPNKCQHDLLAAFAVYRKAFDHRAKLSVVGGITSPRYLDAITALARTLDIADAVELVHQVDHAELLAYHHASDVFVCLSEHEGFCVPIVGAMELDLPVVAYAAAAVPDTVGEAGLLLDQKEPLAVAAAVAELLEDRPRLDAQIQAGRRRAAEFSLPHTSAAMLAALQAGIATPSPVAIGSS